jgi:hypothetical protein
MVTFEAIYLSHKIKHALTILITQLRVFIQDEGSIGSNQCFSLNVI